MKKFEVGKSYSCRSACDHNCVWTWKVLSRTESTITIIERLDKKAVTKRINKKASEWNNAETVYPFGRYSMCPSIEA